MSRDGTAIVDGVRQVAEYARKNDHLIACENIANALERLLESHSNDDVRVGDDA